MSGPPVQFSVANATKTFQQYKVTDSERVEKPPNVTNLNFDKIKLGKFHVAKTDYETFLSHVANYVFDDRVPLGFVERPLTEKNDGTRLSPLRVDLDFRFPATGAFMEDGTPKRVVSIDEAMNFVSVLWEELCKIVDFTEYEPDTAVFYGMRKPKPELDEKNNLIKDGLHVFCKQIQLVPELHLYLRKRVMNRLDEILPSECFIATNKQDIYDETVLYKGGWMLHGNRKKDKAAYNVIFRANYDPKDISKPATISRSRLSKDANKQLVKTLSIRYGIEGTYAPGINEDIRSEFREFVSKNAKARQSLNLNSVKNHRDPISLSQSSVIESQMLMYALDDTVVLDKTNYLKTAAWLVDMLGESRSSSFGTWANVGICLRNMSRVEGLPDVRTGTVTEKMPDGNEIIIDNGMFNLWIAFSRKSPKYVEGMEEKEDWYNKFWLKFTSKSDLDSMIKRPTLKMWARSDSPERYQKFLDTDVKTELERVVRGGGTHVDVANLARIMYGDEFICANIKNKLWYQFQKSSHRFVRIDSATTLRRKLNTIIRGKFEAYAADRSKYLNRRNEQIRTGDLTGSDGAELTPVDIQKDEYIKTAFAITRSLGQSKFLNDVINECQHRFYETYGEDFIKKLDTNKDLICFNNGVYDMNYDEFRDGRPEDMVSMTVGYDYVEYDEDDPKVEFIREMFGKIFTESDVNTYMWKIMASVICGENWMQEIYFMNGAGANGKSVLASWMAKAMGDYAIKPNVTLITDKRTNAQSASPETYSLKNKRFVYMEEPDEGDDITINNGLLKDWSGGGTLRGRPLYGELESFAPMFKLFFSCNAFPKITPEEAMWRRLKVIHFKSKFIKKGVKISDPETQFERDERVASEDFIAEYVPQFMSMLIEEYRKQWRDRKLPFHEPEAVLQFSREKRMESEVIHQIFDSVVSPIDAGELAATYIGDDEAIQRDLLTEEDIYLAIRNGTESRTLLKKKTKSSIRASIRQYLDIINAREIHIKVGGKDRVYYPYKLLLGNEHS